MEVVPPKVPDFILLDLALRDWRKVLERRYGVKALLLGTEHFRVVDKLRRGVPE